MAGDCDPHEIKHQWSDSRILHFTIRATGLAKDFCGLYKLHNKWTSLKSNVVDLGYCVQDLNCRFAKIYTIHQKEIWFYCRSSLCILLSRAARKACGLPQEAPGRRYCRGHQSRGQTDHLLRMNFHPWSIQLNPSWFKNELNVVNSFLNVSS